MKWLLSFSEVFQRMQKGTVIFEIVNITFSWLFKQTLKKKGNGNRRNPENDVQKSHAQNKHTEESTRPHRILSTAGECNQLHGEW